MLSPRRHLAIGREVLRIAGRHVYAVGVEELNACLRRATTHASGALTLEALVARHLARPAQAVSSAIAIGRIGAALRDNRFDVRVRERAPALDGR